MPVLLKSGGGTQPARVQHLELCVPELPSCRAALPPPYVHASFDKLSCCCPSTSASAGATPPLLWNTPWPATLALWTWCACSSPTLTSRPATSECLAAVAG